MAEHDFGCARPAFWYWREIAGEKFAEYKSVAHLNRDFIRRYVNARVGPAPRARGWGHRDRIARAAPVDGVPASVTGVEKFGYWLSVRHCFLRRCPFVGLA